MPTAEELLYDPVETFVDVFADGLLACHVADALTCSEVNVLAGLLAAEGYDDAADHWLNVHKTDCEEPRRH